jgi:hypothetical protein
MGMGINQAVTHQDTRGDQTVKRNQSIVLPTIELFGQVTNSVGPHTSFQFAANHRQHLKRPVHFGHSDIDTLWMTM